MFILLRECKGIFADRCWTRIDLTQQHAILWSRTELNLRKRRTHKSD